MREWLAAAVAVAVTTAPAMSRDTRSAETDAVMHGFMHRLYDGHDLAGTHAAYYSPDFTQHNPDEGNRPGGDEAFIAARGARDPEHFRPITEWINKVDHTLVDGDCFAIHHRLYTNPNDSGRVFIDIFRVAAGKVVEHWDVIQPIPTSAKNANTMTGDLVPTRAPRPGEPVPYDVIRDYLRLGLERSDPAGAAERYVADDFRQHSPHIADGKAALIAYFKAKPPASPTRFDRVSHILADGDLVLVTRHAGDGPDDRGRMYADLFRVAAGKIVEHWDVIQPIPASADGGIHLW